MLAIFARNRRKAEDRHYRCMTIQVLPYSLECKIDGVTIAPYSAVCGKKEQPMKIRTEEEIAARELIRSAFHEASHAGLVRHFGAYPSPQIWRNTGHDERLEAAWTGTCEIANLKQTLTKERFSLIAMAGFIGEQIALAKLDSESLDELQENIVEMLSSAIDNGELSEADLGYIAEDASDAHVRQSFQLLINCWNDIELDANSMIAQAKELRPTDQYVIYPETGRPSMTEYFGIKIEAGEVEDINTFLGINSHE